MESIILYPVKNEVSGWEHRHLRFAGTFREEGLLHARSAAALEVTSLVFVLFCSPLFASSLSSSSFCLTCACVGRGEHWRDTKVLCITCLKTHFRWAWVHRPLILALWKQRQAYICEFKAYVVSSQSGLCRETLSQKRKKRKRKKLFGFCQSIAKWQMWALVPVCVRGKKSITCPSVGSGSH